MNYTLTSELSGRTLCTDMETHLDQHIGIGARHTAKVWKTRKGVEKFLAERSGMARHYDIKEVEEGMWR